MFTRAPPPVPILSQINPVHAPIPLFEDPFAHQRAKFLHDCRRLFELNGLLVFHISNTEIMSSSPTRGTTVCLFLCSVFWEHRGLVTVRSLVQAAHVSATRLIKPEDTTIWVPPSCKRHLSNLWVLV